MGIDVMLALDLSGSMRAEDFQPDNRLVVARQVLRDFIARASENRIGLVAFAGRSVTLCPLTTDHSALQAALDQVDFESVGQDGTAIGDGLGNALYRLGETGAKSRIIVLLSDGENNSGFLAPLDAARMARARGIRVYTIAVGRPGGAPIPIVDEFGRKVYLRNRDGSLVLPRIDEATLQDIATRTGGHYFRATDPASLRQAYREVGNLERSRIVITGQQEREDRSWIPLMVALAALVLEGLLRLGPWAVLRLERRLG
jgi:Ca-activated chloride channel family protein